MTSLVQIGGTWNATPTTNLDDAIYEVTVSVTDPAGQHRHRNTGSLTIDTILPSVTITGGATATTNDPTPTIRGTTDGNLLARTVTITGLGVAMTSLVQIGGTWNATPVTDLAIGTDDRGRGVGSRRECGHGHTTAHHQLGGPESRPGFPILDLAVGVQRSRSNSCLRYPSRVRARAAFRSVAKHMVGGADELQVRVVDLGGFVPADGRRRRVHEHHRDADPVAPGFVTVYPCGARELVSSVNYVAGQTVANAVIAPLSASGTICIFSSSPTDVVGDLNGWFPTGVIFTPIGPKRVFDTRPDQAKALRQVATTQIPAGGSIEVQLTDLAGLVLAVGVSAVLERDRDEPGRCGLHHGVFLRNT